MTIHHLGPQTDTVIDTFAREQPAVLTVDAGDTVVVGSLDASGYLHRLQSPGEPRPVLIPDSRGHCLTGPIEVRGAEPGATLAIRFDAIDPGEWGWTMAGARDNALNRRLGLTDTPPSWLLWDLQWEASAGTGTGTNDRGHRVRLAPFLGVIGMPPPEPGEHSTIPPRAFGGGNIDCRSLIAGSTLYLPVTVPGAMLCLGDGHAAQGDGEVSGTAIECPMTTTVVLDLVTDRAVPGIHAETPSGRITFGFNQDLNEAMAEALQAMVGWMQVLYGLDRATALALASPTVDLRITQVANEVWGVHAMLANDAIS